METKCPMQDSVQMAGAVDARRLDTFQDLEGVLRVPLDLPFNLPDPIQNKGIYLPPTPPQHHNLLLLSTSPKQQQSPPHLVIACLFHPFIPQSVFNFCVTFIGGQCILTPSDEPCWRK